jgi:hypothetical protein
MKRREFITLLGGVADGASRAATRCYPGPRDQPKTVAIISVRPRAPPVLKIDGKARNSGLDLHVNLKEKRTRSVCRDAESVCREVAGRRLSS